MGCYGQTRQLIIDDEEKKGFITSALLVVVEPKINDISLFETFRI
jgi:hypothetical protein